MASLTIRNVDEDLKTSLRVQAAHKATPWNRKRVRFCAARCRLLKPVQVLPSGYRSALQGCKSKHCRSKNVVPRV